MNFIRLGEFACGFIGSITNCSSMTFADSSLVKGFLSAVNTD